MSWRITQRVHYNFFPFGEDRYTVVMINPPSVCQSSHPLFETLKNAEFNGEMSVKHVRGCSFFHLFISVQYYTRERFEKELEDMLRSLKIIGCVGEPAPCSISTGSILLELLPDFDFRDLDAFLHPFGNKLANAISTFMVILKLKIQYRRGLLRRYDEDSLRGEDFYEDMDYHEFLLNFEINFMKILFMCLIDVHRCLLILRFGKGGVKRSILKAVKKLRRKCEKLKLSKISNLQELREFVEKKYGMNFMTEESVYALIRDEFM